MGINVAINRDACYSLSLCLNPMLVQPSSWLLVGVYNKGLVWVLSFHLAVMHLMVADPNQDAGYFRRE